MSKERERLVVGCMTGTSLDGLDVALTRITGSGLAMRAEFVGMHSQGIPEDLRESLMHLASGGSAEPITYMRAARQLGELHAEAVEYLLKEHGNQTPDFIVAHGQTIWHAPPGSAARRSKYAKGETAEPGDVGMSWQLFDPWPVVKRIGVPVCYDLRQADLIAGGEGAPLTPLADWVMYRKPRTKRIVANLGGICNLTILPNDRSDFPVTASDIGPCNLLLDGLVQRLFPEQRFDKGGVISSQGGIWEEFSQGVVNAEFFSRPWPKSAGREVFGPAWIEKLVSYGRGGIPSGEMSDADMIASAIFAIADYMIANSLGGSFGGDELILAGGGALNPNLVESIRLSCNSNSQAVILSDALGIPCEAREAMGFAVLGALSQDGVPVSLPQVTGATDPGVAGVWAGISGL